jgi:hypothetical protein
MTKQLTAQNLQAISQSVDQGDKCDNCAHLNCKGWETMPSSFNQEELELVGTLKSGNEELWDEYHPKGTQIWSADAPIAPYFHPYNKCDVYACKKCATAYLRYTEFGGYYVDQRIREVSPNLITDQTN